MMRAGASPAPFRAFLPENVHFPVILGYNTSAESDISLSAQALYVSYLEEL